MPADDFCQWEGCEHYASYVILDVEVKKGPGDLQTDVGDVALCRGHYLFARRTGRLNLSWERVLRALAV